MNFDIEWPASASALGHALQKKRGRGSVVAGFFLSLTIVASVAFQVFTRTTATNYESSRAGPIRDLAIALDGLANAHSADAADSQMRRLRQIIAEDSQREAVLDLNMLCQSVVGLALSLLAAATLCVYYAVVYHQRRRRADSGKSMNGAPRPDPLENSLASRASFDIRSALMAILGYCDLPRDEGSPVQDRFNSIRKQTCGIVAAIDGFLEIPAAYAPHALHLTPPANSDQPHAAARVLLAEDDPHLQQVIKFYLQSSGADVVIVADGQLAYEEAMLSSRRGTPFDLILMDVQMPKLDGCQTTIQLREAGYVHPIVALTADATDQEQRRCMAAGCNGFLAKPVDREEFSLATRRFLRRELYAQQAAAEVPDQSFDAQMDKLRESFRGEIASRIAEITLAVSAQDMGAVADLAHRLKGTSGCYGFAALSDSSNALQSAAALPETDRAIRACLQTLSEQSEKLILVEAA
jgi:CheY-like chemotaxis protein